jgi:hypothetical protein
MFIQLLALTILHYGNDSKLSTVRIIIASLLMSLSTVVRSTGSITSLIPLFYMLHKLIRNWFHLQKPSQEV